MMQCEDLKDDERPSNTLEHFTELEQVLQMIDTMKPYDAPGFEKDYEQYTSVLTRYQEQPHLLDAHLDVLVERLLTKVRNKSLPESVMHAAFKYLYIISKVRTYKALVKFLPHELCDLEFALGTLEDQDPKEFKNWETRYMLLLWLSILVLNPFQLSRLDAYITMDEGASRNSIDTQLPAKTTMERIFDVCKVYTANNDTCSSIAAYLTAKYLIRADIKDIYLEQYLNCVIAQHNSNSVDVKFGQLGAIASILKHGKREDLLPYANKLLRWIIDCHYKDNNDFLKYKSYIKIIQRIGLVFLKPRIAGWRYKRGTRSLAMNLNRDVVSIGETDTGNESSEDGDEIFIPDGIEEVIEELLDGLRSGGSDIRWNAAKGLGRVTNRLPKSFADEVIGSVIDILRPAEPHEAWHGACLALAELAKRGLLLPNRLRALVPLLIQALFYDVIKGYMSVGQHIRDAACYMSWAFARAYNPVDLQPFVQEISAGLLTVAVYDREIHCRRAAAAAFQECVGRLGNFPHGITISTATDFFSVGLRQNAYLKVSDFIAQFEQYQRPLIDHLVERKVNHWDMAIRELAAKTLHKLALHAPNYMATVVLEQLFANTDSSDINARHGSILAIGEITLALSEAEDQKSSNESKLLSNQIISYLNELIEKFILRNQFRSMQGEIMKQCCADFIKNCSLAHVHVTPECLESWQYIIDQCLLNKTAPVREAGAAALAELCKSYYNTDEKRENNSNIIRAYLKAADNDLEQHIRMGYVNALGVLPAFMIEPHLDEILDGFVKHCLTPTQSFAITGDKLDEHETVATSKWSEARRDSVKALSNLIETIGFERNKTASFGNPQYFDIVMNCFLKAMEEYTLDNRGDIGAWVREAAMNANYKLITTCPRELLKPEHVHNTVLGFVQQSVEKIDRTRGLAARLFCSLINENPPIPHIRQHERLLEIFPSDVNSVLWLFADQTFPLFCSLLELPDYSQRVLLGLSASIGQLTESLMKYSSVAFFDFLRSNPAEVPRLCREIVANFENNILNERVTYPMLSFLAILLGSEDISAILLDDSSTFADDIFHLLNTEIKGYKKLYKLASSISVYCHLIQVPRLCPKILSKLSIFLGLTHVHIRKTSASKLLEALTRYGGSCYIPEENLDEIFNLLMLTDWGLPLVTVRPIRNKICELMGIKPPVSGVGKTTVSTTTSAVAATDAGAASKDTKF